VRQRNLKFSLTTSHLIIIIGAWIDSEMVDIVDRETAWNSRLVVTIAVGKVCVETNHGQILSFELTLESLEGIARERTFFYLLEISSNLSAGVRYKLVIERSIQELRSAWLHLSGCLY
jgi:hypothetical protein